MDPSSPDTEPVQRGDRLPLSLLNDLLYCERRAGLKLVEGLRAANQHTHRGDIVHEHADLAGYEMAQGVMLLRALPVWSDSLGLNGKCDIVERRPDGVLYPVEFKLGQRRRWENDDVQLCAQALCLEEMFSVLVPGGAIFHADSKRRRDVPFTSQLRQATVDAARRLHDMLRRCRVPVACYTDACEQCSLYPSCLPKATGSIERASRLARQLFQT